MRETLYVVLPILLGVGVSQINKIVDRSLASMVSEGALSALSYASIINNAVQEVLVTGIITILFASCATYVAEGRTDEVKKVTSKTMEFMLFLLIPGTVGIVLLAEPIVSCVLQRGNFDGDSLRMTVGALRCYAIGLSFLAVRDMLVKVFYAYKETKITTATSIMAILLHIGLNFLLSYFWGINGLALATSFSAVFQCVILYVLLRRKIGDFGLKRTLLVLAGILASSAVMAAFVLLFRLWFTSFELMEMVKLILLVAIGMIAYALAALAFRLPQATAVTKKIFKRKGV
jgi:putative peptidoglycan lipid II flippase